MVTEKDILFFHKVGVADIAVPRGEVAVPEHRQAFFVWAGCLSHALDPPLLQLGVHTAVFEVRSHAIASELIQRLLVFFPARFEEGAAFFGVRLAYDVRVQVRGFEVASDVVVFDQSIDSLIQTELLPLLELLRGATEPGTHEQVPGLRGTEVGSGKRAERGIDGHLE